MAKSVNITAVPFLTPSTERIFAPEWTDMDGAPLGSIMPSWDYNATISATRRMIIDTNGVCSECRFSHDAVLRLSVIAASGGANVRRLCYSHELLISENPEEISIESTLGNDSLAGNLLITTALTIVDPGQNPGQFAPVSCGTLLWKDSHLIVLEGSGSRFPMEIIDFKTAGWISAGAGWYLDWDPEFLDHPFMGSVRLYINKSHQKVLKAVSTHSPDDEDSAVLSALYYDTGRSLITGALCAEEFVDEGNDWHEGSIGYVIEGLFKTFFPGETYKTLRHKLKHESELFNAVLRDRFALFRSGSD